MVNYKGLIIVNNTEQKVFMNYRFLIVFIAVFFNGCVLDCESVGAIEIQLIIIAWLLIAVVFSFKGKKAIGNSFHSKAAINSILSFGVGAIVFAFVTSPSPVDQFLLASVNALVCFISIEILFRLGFSKLNKPDLIERYQVLIVGVVTVLLASFYIVAF